MSLLRNQHQGKHVYTRMKPPILDRRSPTRPTPLPIPGRYRSRLEYLEWLTERSVPLGPWSFGLDGILGLIPGFGDLISGLVSTYIVACAARDGVPRASIARMMANVAIDTALGSLPLIGDIFDFMYKANSKNLVIYREAMEGRRETRKDWWFVALFVTAALILIAIPVALAIAIIIQLIHHFKLF